MRWFDYSSERDINSNVEVLWITCSNWTWTFTWRLVDSSFVFTKYLKSSTEHSKLKKIHTHVRIILDFCHPINFWFRPCSRESEYFWNRKHFHWDSCGRSLKPLWRAKRKTKKNAFSISGFTRFRVYERPIHAKTHTVSQISGSVWTWSISPHLLRRINSHRRNKEIKINIHLCSINRTTRNILFLCFRDKTSPCND